jgi:AhpD family alkylhydroperoxidase
MSETQDHISTIRKMFGTLMEETSGQMQAFSQFVQSVEKQGPLDEKTLELVIIGIAVAKQCDHCINLHVDNALKAGASREEIMTAGWAAIIMNGGPSLMYMQTLIKALDDLG